MLQSLRRWAREIKRDVVAVWLATRDPRVPWYAKAVAFAVAAYAFSPIDLIPDFVPVFGYLDEVVILPLGILLAVKLIPKPLMREFRAEAARREYQPEGCSLPFVALVAAIWLVAIAVAIWLFWPVIARLISN